MHPAKAIRPVSTISIVFVRGLLSALLQRGTDPGEWLLRAGISPGFLKEDAARVTSAQYTALFRVLVEALDDEGIGFFSRPLRRGSLALVIRSTLGARTAGAALKRILNGLQLLQEDVRFAFVTRGERVGVQMEIPPAYLPERIFIHEMLLRILLSITAWLHGAHLKKLVFDLATPRPRYAAEFTRLFPGEVHFDQARTALWFDAAVLNQSMRHDETSLRLFLERTPEAIIVPERRQLGASGRVRKCLLAGRPQWRSLEEVADALHMAVSTLQRHLASEGTSFQALKDELRRDVAIARLNSSTTPLAALALELGFSDSATFQRAFKTWTGSAPGAYRLHAGCVAVRRPKTINV